jgi:hypothetical protein
MASKIKNIILFTVIAAALILAYVFFFKKAPEQAPLVSSSGVPVLPAVSSDQTSEIGRDFLSVLLNVKNIRLNDSIFSDSAFLSLHDSSILLIPTANETEGRPNPFAPIGSDITATVTTSTEAPAILQSEPASTDTGTNTQTNQSILESLTLP